MSSEDIAGLPQTSREISQNECNGALNRFFASNIIQYDDILDGCMRSIWHDVCNWVCGVEEK